MSTFRNIAIGVGVVGFVLLMFNPLLGAIVLAAAVAIPVAVFLMLDPSQRRRLRRIQERKQLGR